MAPQRNRGDETREAELDQQTLRRAIKKSDPGGKEAFAKARSRHGKKKLLKTWQEGWSFQFVKHATSRDDTISKKKLRRRRWLTESRPALTRCRSGWQRLIVAGLVWL